MCDHETPLVNAIHDKQTDKGLERVWNRPILIIIVQSIISYVIITVVVLIAYYVGMQIDWVQKYRQPINKALFLILSIVPINMTVTIIWYLLKYRKHKTDPCKGQ